MRNLAASLRRPLAIAAARGEFVQNGVAMRRFFNHNRIFTLAEL